MACNGPGGPVVTAQDGPLAAGEAGGAGEADVALLAAEARRLGIDLDRHQQEQFGRYRAALLEWNQRVNLTAITDPSAVMTRHFLDSLTALVALSEDQRSRSLHAV